MQLLVRAFDANTHVVDVSEGASVGAVKVRRGSLSPFAADITHSSLQAQIARLIGLPPTDMLLAVGGRPMVDDNDLLGTLCSPWLEELE